MEKFRYNNLTARHEKVNHVFLLGSDLLFVVMAVYFWLYSQEAGRPMWIVWANCAVLALFLVVNTILFQINKSMKMLRIIVSAQVIGAYIFYSMTTPATFLGMALMGILGISIAYFDTRFFNILFLLCTVLYVTFQIIRSSSGVTEANANGVCQVIMNVAIFVMLQRIAAITKVFNDHSLGAIAQQQEVQEQMVREILDISQIVKDESDRSRMMVARLLDSARQTAVNIHEITQTTETTAGSLAEQTAMTRDIQRSIDETKARSGEMVTIASDSSDHIMKNIEMMHELKEQSAQIARTNDQVTKSMEKLQQKTMEVEKFAGAILSISDQTNLLAVNASIESARAGAAGKGFAVVARQIRQLAEETRESTESISSLLNDLKATSHEVITTIRGSVEAADKQNSMILTTADMFDQLGRNMSQLISNISMINDKIENLSNSNHVMVDSISQISASTQEIAASAEATNTITEQNLQYAQNTSKAISSIQKTSSRLEQYI